MSDDKTEVGQRDRSSVSGSESHEGSYFAQKHDLTSEAARALIKAHGPDREILDAAADKLKWSRK